MLIKLATALPAGLGFAGKAGICLHARYIRLPVLHSLFGLDIARASDEERCADHSEKDGEDCEFGVHDYSFKV